MRDERCERSWEQRKEETHVVVNESVVVGNESDGANDRNEQRSSPRYRRPEQGARDGKERRICDEGENESEGDLVLCLVFLEGVRGGVAGEEIDGKMDDEGEEEEGKADEAGESREDDRSEDAHASWKRMRDGRVERGRKRKGRERKVGNAGGVERVSVDV